MTLDYIKIIHFLFPPSEDERTLLETTVSEFTTLLSPLLHQDVIALLPYSDKRVTAAIHLNKYHCHNKSQKLLSNVLNEYVASFTYSYTIIPIPLSKKRKRARGYNQVEEVVRRSITKQSSHVLDTSILKRSRDTVAQTTLTRNERLHNMKNAFTASSNASEKLSRKHLLLIDDVVTTGATLQAAKAALLKHEPASITCIALAH